MLFLTSRAQGVWDQIEERAARYPDTVPEPQDGVDPAGDEEPVADGEEKDVKKVLAKMHPRLRYPRELVKLHLKHYHRQTKTFKAWTS